MFHRRQLAFVVTVAIIGAVVALGCASDLVATDGGWRHQQHGYSIGTPDASRGWQRAQVEGALLAFRRAGTDTMSLQSRCRGAVAGASVMARHLLIGVPDRELESAGPVEVAGLDGWSQTFVSGDAPSVRIKTITVVRGDCTVDWVLASTGDFATAETDFDAWWQSFDAASVGAVRAEP